MREHIESIVTESQQKIITMLAKEMDSRTVGRRNRFIYRFSQRSIKRACALLQAMDKDNRDAYLAELRQRHYDTYRQTITTMNQIQQENNQNG